MNELENRDAVFEVRDGETEFCETAAPFAKSSVADCLEQMAEILPGGVRRAYLEEGFPLYAVNDKQLELLGCGLEELLGLSEGLMCNLIYEEDRVRVADEMKKQLARSGEYEVTYRVVRKDGTIIWVHDGGRRVVAENGRDALIAIMADRTKQTEWEISLINAAEHDFLTSLHNRRKAVCLLEKQFEKEDKGILFLFDVDNFKRINDTKGHAAGDRALVKLSSIIRKRAGEAFVAARFGGDEYLMYFDETTKRENAIETVHRIQMEFASDMEKMLPGLHVSLSAGGRIRNEAEDFQTLYKKADEALYQAKQKKGDLKVL